MEKKSSGCKRSITITLGRDCPFQDCSKKLLFKIRNIRQRLYPLPKSMSIILNNANKYLFDKQESAPIASLSSQKKRPAPATSLSSQKKSAPATSLSSQKKDLLLSKN